MELTDLERGILEWVAASYPTLKKNIERIPGMRVLNREVRGAGAFITFDEEGFGRDNLIFDGPGIQSPDLQFGADTLAYATPDGAITLLEIRAVGNDYPLGKELASFRLAKLQDNIIDLR